MTPTSTLSYQGTTIRLRGAMLNLTDMWRAAGRPEDRRPARTIYQAAALPCGARVKVQAVAVRET